MAQALVIDTAAAKSIRQEIGSPDLASPEWPLKDDCHAQVIAPVRRPPHRDKAAFAHDFRLLEPIHYPLDHFLNATFDRVESHITWVVHQYILQPVEGAGQMRPGRRIAAHSGLNIAPCVLVWNFIEHFPKCPMRPWVLSVDGDM